MEIENQARKLIIDAINCEK